MFANEYQGGAQVEVLGTQGQNPLAQWKVTGPQKGLQKVYDKVRGAARQECPLNHLICATCNGCGGYPVVGAAGRPRRARL
jgi:hypothetical protein